MTTQLFVATAMLWLTANCHAYIKPQPRPPSGYAGLDDYPVYNKRGDYSPAHGSGYGPGGPDSGGNSDADYPSGPTPGYPGGSTPGYPGGSTPGYPSGSTPGYATDPKPGYPTKPADPEYPKKPGTGYGQGLYNNLPPYSGPGYPSDPSKHSYYDKPSGYDRSPYAGSTTGYGEPFPPLVPYDGSQKPPGVINYGYKYKYGAAPEAPTPPQQPVSPLLPRAPAKPLFSFQTLAPRRDPACYHEIPAETVLDTTVPCDVTSAYYFDIQTKTCRAVSEDNLCHITYNNFGSQNECEQACLPACPEFSQTACAYNPFPVTGKGYSFDTAQNECREVDFILGCEGEGILFPTKMDCVDGCVRA